MRTLLYGMPSSGATFVAWQLAQSPDCVGILDMTMAAVPEASEFAPGQDVVIKINARRPLTLETAVKRFEPDEVVIVTRDEEAVRESLLRRVAAARLPQAFLPVRGRWGIGRLFRRFRAVLDSGRYDRVIRYEDAAPDGVVELPRTLLEIAMYNHERVPWCRVNRPQRWSFGGLRHPSWSGDRQELVSRVIRFWGYEVDGYATRLTRYFARHGVVRAAAEGVA